MLSYFICMKASVKISCAFMGAGWFTVRLHWLPKALFFYRIFSENFRMCFHLFWHYGNISFLIVLRSHYVILLLGVSQSNKKPRIMGVVVTIVAQAHTHTETQYVWPRTLSPENEAPVSSLPGHLFKAHQGGVDAETLAALPNSVGVAGADTRHQGHWGQTHTQTNTLNQIVHKTISHG